MEIPRHPLRPLTHALRAVGLGLRSPLLWIPFVALGLFKALVLVGAARIDLWPAVVLTPLLTTIPGLERHLHYPGVLLHLPLLAQVCDLALFLTAGALVQGWAIAHLARSWSKETPVTPAPVWFSWRVIRGLVGLAAVLVVVPFAAVRAAYACGADTMAPNVGFAVGSIVSMLLFVAPAFLVLHGLGLRGSIVASAGMLGRLPVALPLAVLGIAVLHAPALVLRSPAIRAGAANDPDWILGALLGQLPADVLGAVFSAGLAAYFAWRTHLRRSGPRQHRATPLVAAALVVSSLVNLGCDSSPGREVTLRYEAERWVERARLRQRALADAETPPDSLAWLEVVRLYDRAVERLGVERVARGSESDLDHDLGRLACKALLGRAEAGARAGRVGAARRDYGVLLAPTVPYRGAAGDAALGLGRCEDRSRNWDAALTAYTAWMRGVGDDHWPLHDTGLDVAPYVARRLRDRGDAAARAAWIDLSARALAAAAERGELARQARYARFGLLLAGERWDDAYAALRELRLRHDPEGHDGGLVVAEASLLAGGLGREHEALGLLAGMNGEKSAYDSQHRVAGMLLLGQIHMRSGDLQGAQRAYEGAGAEARSESGRAEAALGMARVHAARGEIADARRYYRQLREVYAATPAGLLAPLEEIRMLQVQGAEAEVRALLPVAIQVYRGVIAQFGTERPALLAARCMSECMGLAGHWERGVAFLDSISVTFGSDPRAGSLLVRAARLAVERLDDPARAEAILGRLHARHPDSDIAVLARGYEDSLGLRPSTP